MYIVNAAHCNTCTAYNIYGPQSINTCTYVYKYACVYSTCTCAFMCTVSFRNLVMAGQNEGKGVVHVFGGMVNGCG